MTAQNPPIFLQAGSHPAEDVRRALSEIVGVGGGVVGDSDLIVSERAGTPNMSVDVAGGSVWVAGTESTYQGAYFCDNRGTTNLVVSLGDATNPRIDLVVARVKDSVYSGASDAWEIAVVEGTAAASPSAPTAPPNSVTLAQIDVAAGASSVVDGDITDLRTFVTADQFRTATLSVTGDMTVDGGTLHVDSGADRVGIGTTAPTQKLDVNGSIATTSGTTNDRGILLAHQNNIDYSYVSRSEGGAVDTGNRLGWDYSDDSFDIRNNGSTRLKIDSSGNVGINDATPSYTLDVDGDINATGDVRVAGNPVGMVLVKTQAVGTGVASVTVTGAFSSEFDAYRIIYTGGTGTADAPYRFRFDASHTVGYFYALNYSTYTGLGPTAIGGNNLGYINYCGGGLKPVVDMTVLDPYNASSTKEITTRCRYATVYGMTIGHVPISSSFTGFQIYTVSGLFSGGTVRVYGFNNG
jgi:hypothetical protein